MTRPTADPRRARGGARPVEAVDAARGNGNGKPHWRHQRDWGGIVARVLCLLFALVGLVPLALGGLVRLERVQNWAAVRTTELLTTELGLEARYDLDLRPWPLELSMENVEIAASDGGGPALRAKSVVARPRIFSLLAGKLDLGDVEIEEPELRIVVRDGKLMNVRYRLPESDGESSEAEAPLSAVSLTNARVDLVIDDIHVRSREIDVDLAIDGEDVEVSARAGDTEVDARIPDPAHPGEERIDEDRLCSLELRARVGKTKLAVRRLEIEGAADLDPAPGTRPGCDLGDGDWRRVSLAVSNAEAALRDRKLEQVDGRIRVRAPVPLVHRLVDLDPVTGWVEIDLESASFETGQRLPEVSGWLRAADLGIDSKVVARSIDAEVSTKGETLYVNRAKVRWGGGDATIAAVAIRPFAKGAPMEAEGIVVDGVTLPDLLNDINVHPNAHVAWSIAHSEVKRFAGTLDPPNLAGPMVNDTKAFAIYDRPHTDPNKHTMMAVERGDLTGVFKVTPQGIVLSNFTVVTPRSRVQATVTLGFDEAFGMQVHKGSRLDFRDISPLVDIEMAGMVTVEARGSGTFDDPKVEGTISVDGFEFAGLPIGDVKEAKARFVPMSLTLEAAKMTSGESHYDVPSLLLDFDDGDADVVLRGRADTRASGLRLVDFFSVLELEHDPRWKDIRGTGFGVADIDFVLGGRRDRCGEGRLSVRGNMDFKSVSLWGEDYDTGAIDVDYLWDDIAAGDRGLSVDIHSAVMTKGSGSLVASGSIRHGARLDVSVTGAAIPLERVRAFQGLFGGPQKENDPKRKVRPEADLSFVAHVGGTFQTLEAQAEIDVSKMRIGPDVLPTSHFSLAIEPAASGKTGGATTRCGNIVAPTRTAETRAPEAAEGIFRLAGALFDQQIRFEDLEITQEARSMVSGTLVLADLDLGAFANLLPDVAFSAEPPRGRLSAEVVIDELPVAEPGLAEVRMFVKRASVARAGTKLQVASVSEPVVLSGDALRIPPMPVTVTFPTGLRGTLMTGGTISNLASGDPQLRLSMRMDPVDLSKLGVDIPQIERAAGEVRATILVNGTFESPRLGGNITIANGQLRIEGVPVALDDIDVDVRISGDEIRIQRAKAQAGNTGHLSLSGRFPLKGLEIAGGSATLVARDVKLPIADGVKVTADAMLNATFDAPNGAKRELPNITGTVSLTHFSYTRPMSFSVDIDELTSRRRTEVDTYKPEDDLFTFDIKLMSPRALKISNNLVDMRLAVTPPGIQISGSNQRYGARGALKIEPASKLFLQGHDFAVRDGTVTFDNPTKIAATLDVHATTEYRRYQASGDLEATAGSTDASGSSAGGKWRIAMHAYGDTEEPKVRFTSDPPLSQDDIVLLLQVGMTRAELDRGLAGSLAQTVGIEAISAVTGLNQAVKKTLPLFDDVHVGSQYSSRSGRPEPTVTVGKRITDDVRATVTTGLSETREVRSNIEWKLSRGVSVTGSYDNVNDVSSSALGNVGADLRWRLEFE